MPRFFFNVDDGDFVPDVLGTELPNLEAARAAAIVLAGEMLRDAPHELVATGHLTIAVADEWGLTLLTVEVRLTARTAGAGRAPESSEGSGPRGRGG